MLHKDNKNRLEAGCKKYHWRSVVLFSIRNKQNTINAYYLLKYFTELKNITMCN